MYTYHEVNRKHYFDIKYLYDYKTIYVTGTL